MSTLYNTRLPDRVTDRLTPFREDALRPASWGYLAWLVVALALSMMVFRLVGDKAVDGIRASLLVHYTIVAVHVTWRLRTGGWSNVLAPDIPVVLLYSAFHTAMLLIFDLGLLPFDRQFIYYDASIPKALFIANIGLVGLLAGYEIVGGGGLPKSAWGRLRVPNPSWCVFGIIVMVAAILMHVGGLLALGIDKITMYGYTAIQRAEQYSSYHVALFLSKSNYVMTFGLVIYLIGSSLRYRKLFRSKLALGLVAGYVAVLVLEGDRGPMILLGAPILLIRHYFVKQIRVPYLVILLAGILMTFTVLAKVRGLALNPTQMWQEYEYQQQAGEVTWLNPFMEMGRQIQVMIIVANDVPGSWSYWNGSSWGSAALHIVPFLQGFALERGWVKESPSEWLTRTYFGEKAAGTGFLISAEGYLNFGYLGAFVEVMAFGMFIRWLAKWLAKRPSGPRAFLLLGALGPAILIIRNHANVASGTLAQVLVVTLLLHWTLGSQPAESLEEPPEEARMPPGRPLWAGTRGH